MYTGCMPPNYKMIRVHEDTFDRLKAISVNGFWKMAMNDVIRTLLDNSELDKK